LSRGQLPLAMRSRPRDPPRPRGAPAIPVPGPPGTPVPSAPQLRVWRNTVRSFLLAWVGQTVSALGSNLTGFALAVWIYQQTGSVTAFALITLVTTLPGMLLLLVSGALVDRCDRRWAMILSNGGAGLATLALALLI